MQPHERSPVVVSSLELVRQEDEIVRVIPVGAAPPETRVLAMLGQARSDAPAAALRIIRHRLERLRADGIWTLGVTSARDGEGKSTLAAQLALVLGESQRARVLLVEASMHRPSLARLFGFQVPAGMGFSVQLARKMRGSLEPWTVLAVGPTLHALVENEAESGFPETLHSTHFRRAIERLAGSYDWVVIDSASVLGSGDANVVEDAADAMVVAARSGASRGGELRAVLRQLGDRKTVGVVLWDVASRRGKR
jgi:Mrp family chromosome partitioning ATPase